MSEQSKLKIVFLISELGKGGSERQLFLLLTHMDFALIEPVVVVFNPCAPSYQPELQAAGIRVIEIPPKKKNILARLLFLINLLLREQPQVVHSWSVHNNPYASLAGWVAQVPVRVGSMRDSLKNRDFQSLPWLLKKLAIRCIPIIFVNADSIKRELLAIKVSPKKIIILKNCVSKVVPPTGSPVEVFNLPHTASNCRIIGTVCNLRAKKNIHIFIQGLAQVMGDDENLIGVIIGQPIPEEQNYYHRIQSLIYQLNLTKRIFLLGFRDDAPVLMHYFDIFCLLSEYEGTPNAVLEAMAAGVPVIASAVGGIPDLIEHGVTGLLVPPGDKDAFALALRQLLENHDAAVKMGRDGQHAMLNYFNCTIRAKDLINNYIALLQERQ